MIKITSRKSKNGASIRFDIKDAEKVLNGFLVFIHKDDYKNLVSYLPKLCLEVEKKLNKLLANVK